MRFVRLAVILGVMVGAAVSPARAQWWGGGGIRASARTTPARSAIRLSPRRIDYGGPILIVPAPALDFDTAAGRTSAPGGAWTGHASQWGGSLPSPPARREPFVAPSPVIVPAVAATAVAAPGSPYIPVREQYLRRMRRQP